MIDKIELSHLECSVLIDSQPVNMQVVNEAIKNGTRMNEDNVRAQESYVQEYLMMMRTVDAMVWGRDLSDRMTFPCSWVDAMKLKLMPRFLLRYFPARVKTIKLKEMFPAVSKNSTKIDIKDFMCIESVVMIEKGGYEFPSGEYRFED